MRYYIPRGLSYNLIDPTYPAAALDNLKSALLSGLNAEPDWGPNLAPAGSLTRWFGYSHGNFYGGRDWAMTMLNKLGPGSPSPFFEALDNATQDGAVLVRGTGGPQSLAYIEAATIDDAWQEPGRMVLVILAGGDVEGVPVWFEFADQDAVCPFGDGTETWEQWGAPTQQVHEYGGKFYRGSNTPAGGEPLKASQWFGYYMGGGTVMSTASFNAIQRANAPQV